MKELTHANFAAFFEQADAGTSFRAQIISLKGGNLRVTCNWLYSALNIDPNDASDFLWNISKVDNSHISISPVNSCITKPIYASVRDDYNWYIQVQAPFSADWITAARQDEFFGVSIGDLMITTLKGFNGKLVKRDDSVTTHQNHAGYMIRSIGDTDDDSTNWFLSVKAVSAKGYEWIGGTISLEELEAALNKRKITLQTEELQTLHKAVNR